VAIHSDLTELLSLDDLDRLLAGSHQRPLLLFKHSYSCGTSAAALDELVAHLDAARTDTRYAMVTVQTHRDISNAIAARLGVRHETPQALLVRDSQVVWKVTHHRVTALELGKALAAISPVPPPTPTTTPTGS
jgi:bacillithiol system protein YtxJ